MMGTTRITAQPGNALIQIEREFDAPRDVVFRAHVDPELLAQWLGPHNMTMTIDHFEPRDGGRYRYVHRDPDGNEYGFRGVFHGDPSPDGTIQTFEWEGLPGHVSLDSAVFEARGDKTLVRVTSAFQSVEDRDGMIASGMESGLNEGYERLDQLLARQASPVA
jgi:uncharacterized protein YndB with AHSA1/START domain